MSSFQIEEIETEQQIVDFAQFIKQNTELKSVDNIEAFIKPIQKLLGIVEMDKREVDTSSYNEKLVCENIGFNFLLLKLKNNKSIIFKEFCYLNKEENFIAEYLDCTKEQKECEKFYKINDLVQNVYNAQKKLKEAQDILLCYID